MSTDARSAGAAGAAFAPSCLVGPMHQSEIEPLVTSRCSIVGSSAALLGIAVGAALIAAALGIYLVFAEDLKLLSADATHPELPLASVRHEAASAGPVAQAPMETLLQKSDIESPSEGELHAPRVVRTERFEADPSVWANVRKFSPLPAEEVPILDVAPMAQSPMAAPPVLDAPRADDVLHHEPPRAHSHPLHGADTHTRVKPRTRADVSAPSDVGGTRMTAVEVRQDSSKNPVVSTFSAMLGPK
jgi:hypothetical protein